MTFRFPPEQLEWLNQAIYGPQQSQFNAVAALEEWVGEKVAEGERWHNRFNAAVEDAQRARDELFRLQQSIECPYDCTICHAHEEEE